MLKKLTITLLLFFMAMSLVNAQSLSVKPFGLSDRAVASDTTDIPIVFAHVQKNDADYLKVINHKTTGLLESLFLEQKIKLLKEMFPNIKTLGIITNFEKNKKSVYDIKIATRNLKLTPVIINVENVKSLHQELIANIDNVSFGIPSEIIMARKIIGVCRT